MVNNLCCDHKCLAKVFKRSKTNTKSTIEKFTTILDKVIPTLENSIIRSSMSNMIEIDAQQYIDVVRFVFLFEFYEIKYSRKRVIVDYVPSTQEIIIVDQTDLQEGQNYLELHH